MKKQIAILMAAATAVTTVAPVIASADTTDYTASVATATEAAKKALADKYSNPQANGVNLSFVNLTDDYLNSKYAVLVNKEGQDFKTVENTIYKDAGFEINDKPVVATEWYVVDDADKLQKLLEVEKGNSPQVAIIDKGFNGGESTFKTTKKVLIASDKKASNGDYEVSLFTLATELQELCVKDKPSVIENLKVTANGKEVELVKDKKPVEGATFTGNVTKVKVKLASGKEYTYEANDIAPDLKKAFDKDGKEIKLDGNNAQSVLDVVDHFAEIANVDDKEMTYDIKNGDTLLYKVNKSTEEKLELGYIYSRENGYTEKGKDFVNGIVDSRTTPWKFNFNDHNYFVKAAGSEADPTDESVKALLKTAFDDARIDKIGSEYELKFDIPVQDANDTAVYKTLGFVIKGKSQQDLADILRDLKGSNKVVAGHFTRLIGSDRYATAIAISQDQFDPNSAESVVIVGGEAQLDGLSASPLAAAKNAPMLLANPKSGLSKDTIEEIDRACQSLLNKTVYIVGGTNSVPNSVEKQLNDKFGCTVIRVSGQDRLATSLQVAKRLNYDKDVLDAAGTAFIVGSEGAADAMSIAPVAAHVKDKKVMPIIVVDKNGISRETRNYIKEDLHVTTAYMIGGDASLTTQINDDLKDTAKITTVKRISGEDRYATNVEIIKEFFGKGKSLDVGGAFFASGENKYLVDAQTVGAYAAAKGKSIDKPTMTAAPLVLTGSKLTKDQVKLLENDGVLADLTTNIYQVGGVVSADVMKVVVDKLGL